MRKYLFEKGAGIAGKLFLVIIMLMGFMGLLPVNAVRAGEIATINIGSYEGMLGEEFTINVQVTGESSIQMCDIYITYDKDVISLLPSQENMDVYGGNGIVHILSTDKTSFDVRFKAIAPGRTALTLGEPPRVSETIISSGQEDKMSISLSAGNVKIVSNEALSGDCYLQTLQVGQATLDKSFDAEITEYKCRVNSAVERLVVSAIARDSKARVKISDQNLKPGMNRIVITVIAENGDERYYYITVDKELAEGETAATIPPLKNENVNNSGASASQQTVKDNGGQSASNNAENYAGNDRNKNDNRDNEIDNGANNDMQAKLTFWRTVAVVAIIVALLAVTFLWVLIRKNNNSKNKNE